MPKIALNFFFLGPKHGGGKDQVSFNLLKGFFELDYTKNMIVFCFAHSVETIHNIAPDVEIVSIKGCFQKKEILRMLYLNYINSFVFPHLVKKHDVSLVLFGSSGTGVSRFQVPTIVIPHDIKAVSHPSLGSVRISYGRRIYYRLQYHFDFCTNDKVIAISDFDKSDMQNFFPKYKNKMIRCYDPIATKTILRYSAQDQELPPYSYISALNLQYHHKNIITLIKAFEILMNNVSFDLLLIGNVPERMQYLKDYVQQHGLDKRIHFIGFVQTDEMYMLLSHSKLYVNPSLFEGFGMTAVEAMILKVPTLLSDLAVNREVTHKLCSYYAPIDDSQALTQKILECMNDIPSEDRLQKISQEMVDAYDYLNICREYYEIFDSVIKQYLTCRESCIRKISNSI